MGHASPFVRIALAASVLVAALSSVPAGARTAAPFVPPGVAADAPGGFVEMCGRDAALCSATFVASAPPAASLATAPVSPCAGTPVPPLALLMASGSNTRAFHTLLKLCPVATPPPAGWIDGATGAISADLAQPPPPAPIARASRAGRAAEKLVRRINAEVNHAVRQVADLDLYGADEVWQRPGARNAGDCEDLAIEKRARLVAAGFDPAKLAYGVVFRHGIGLHVVLIARLARGDVVLDSRDFRVRAWSRPDYRWLRIQAFDAPMHWTMLATTATPLGRTAKAS